jgi:hypothetical protein
MKLHLHLHLPQVHRRRRAFTMQASPIAPARAWTAVALAVFLWPAGGSVAADAFEGKFFRGRGDVEYIELLDISRRMFEPDPELQSLPMFYMPAWNGLVEGPTWDAWWIQNSYGPTYCALPFWEEPFLTFIRNSHDLWFDQMGDGKRAGANGWVAPDGCLCDAARPGWIYYRQGDGRVDIHDWGMEFTAGGIVLEAERLLVARDLKSIELRLPLLERCAAFIESRRDPRSNLFLAGPAGNLLAPSFAGWKKPDGSYDKAYLAGLSITYIAALDRLVELEKLAGRAEKAALLAGHRELARKGLPALQTEEGYFIKSLDPDGTRHGVFGAPKYGYFEAVVNHDAICFRVAGDEQAEKIYSKMASISGLRPVDLIITNYPSLDDMYEAPAGLWGFGTWVNGGHWSTCEARMIMAYCRLGKHEDARRSMKRLLGYARSFRMDNPLTKFGADTYQHLPINCVYDNYGIPAALLRGLCEYIYSAEGVTLLPHIPAGITELEQRFPVVLGTKRIYLATAGSGPVTSVLVSGKPWKSFDSRSVFLSWKDLPREAFVQIALGGAVLRESTGWKAPRPWDAPPAGPTEDFWKSPWLAKSFAARPNPLRIGADTSGGSRFIGDIRVARLFRRALKADEIAALSRGEEAALRKDAALVGEWLPGEAREGAVPGGAAGELSAKVVGDVQAAPAAGGKAGRFTGAGFLEVPHDPRLDVAEAHTLEAWICPRGLPPSGGRIIDKSTVGTSDSYLLDTHPGSSLRMITRRGTLSFDAKLPPEQWVHVAGTFEKGGELRLYIGGKLVASKPAQRPGEPGSMATAEEVQTVHDKVLRFWKGLRAEGLEESYEAAHARLALEAFSVLDARRKLMESGKLALLPEPSQFEADKSYVETALKLADGLGRALTSYGGAQDPAKKKILQIWEESRQ